MKKQEKIDRAHEIYAKAREDAHADLKKAQDLCQSLCDKAEKIYIEIVNTAKDD